MAKDPAFLFYPGDYISGTMGMTFEEKGAYIELLMLQFNRGHMTSHMIGQIVGHLWDKLKDKFKVDDQGLYFNSRLDEEKEKRKVFTTSRRNNVTGKNQHTKKDKKKSGHMTSHMEDENVNENIDLVYPFNGEDFKKIWLILIKEKKWRKKSNSALQASLKILSKYTEPEAIQMIEQAIAGEYQGLVENKKQNGNTKFTKPSKFDTALEANRRIEQFIDNEDLHDPG